MDGNKALICVLLDFYGELLSRPVADSIDMYYNEDLSLSEIAENIGISRQGVRDDLRRGVELLIGYEEKLRLYERYKNNKAVLGRCKELLNGCGISPGDKDNIVSLLDSLVL